MKKSTYLVLVCLVVVLCAVKVEHQWPELSIAAENARLDLLEVVLTEPGNAADIYGPYMKDSEAPLFKNESWKSFAKLKYEDYDKAESKATVDKALEAAKSDLAAVKKASKMKDYQLWGKVMKLDPKKKIYAQPFPNFLGVMNLSRLLVAEARQLDQAGDEKAAIENLMAVARMGRQSADEPMLIGFMVSVALKTRAATELADLHERHGRKDASAKWRLYQDFGHPARLAWSKINGLSTSYTESQVEGLLLNDDVPFALRFDLLVARHYCDKDMIDPMNALVCVFTDTPEYIIKIEDELSRRDPVHKMFIDLIKGDSLTFKEWRTYYLDSGLVSP